MDWLAERTGVPTTVLLVLLGVILTLVVGTGVRLALLSGKPTEKRKQRIASLISWWVLALTFVAVVLLGRVAALVLFGLASWQGMREFLALAETRYGGRGLKPLALLAVPVNYLLIGFGWHEAFWMFIPVGMLLLLSTRVILTDRPQGFLEAVGGVSWGLLLIVFCISHAVLFFGLPESSNPVGGPTGWVVYLVLLTEANDIMQAHWGRRFGRRKVTPVISPNKTWEGLVLGSLTTVALAVLVAPVLTPLTSGSGAGSFVRPLLAGLLVAVAGFFGDLALSALKRDVGVKDSGTLIPGQGGLLDRIDSLTFTAPLFYWAVALFYG